MDSFKLQKLLKELSNVDLIPYTDVVNYKLNGRWITDIDRDYYEEISSEILEIIQKDEGEIGEVKSSLVEAKKKTLKKWQDVTTEGEGKLTILKHYATVLPINSTLDFLDDKEQEKRRRIIFDTVIELWELDLGNYNKDDLHSYLVSPEAQNTENQIKFKYAYGHLYYVLSLKVEIIDSLLKDIQDLDEPENISSMKNGNLNPYSIEFNLTKMDIALFFYILHEEGIIKTEGKNLKNRRTHLKKYIDNANIFYLDDNKRIEVNRINKEFTKIEQPKIYNVVGNEKLFLEDLISKLHNRLNFLQDDPSEKN